MALIGYRDTLATAVQDGQVKLLCCKYEHFLLLESMANLLIAKDRRRQGRAGGR